MSRLLTASVFAWWAISAVPASAGIPEPDFVWYGKVSATAGANTIRVTAGTLKWTIEPLAGGTAWELTTQLKNINDQFSFVLRVPCESPEPGGTADVTAGTVQLNSPAVAYRRLTVALDGQPLTISAAPSTFAPARANRGRLERIDLALGTLPPDSDSDGDGMSDAWELQHFGAAGADPDDDADGDGMNNLREYRAGTDPKDARSVFEVVEIIDVPGGLRIRWSSQAGKSYRVRRATTLLANPAGYEVIQSGIAATPPVNLLLDTTTGGSAQFFYLVEVAE